MIYKAANYGSPYIGIYCLLNDNYAFVAPNVDPNFEAVIRRLDVDVVKISIADTYLPALFASVNNKRIILSQLATRDEIKVFKDYFSDVIILSTSYTAVGNLLSMNDYGIVAAKEIAEELKEAKAMTVAGSDLLGASLYANNLAFLSHPDTSDEEMEQIRKVLKVDGGKGTVNFGDPMVATGIIGNKKGIIVGERSTGPEMNRIDDIFIFEKSE
ncbi:hypothetical protein DRN74_04395 [Candidatus Micrarchaeota archaeon]|nr:MAG: hypothetical protein DRN74_04395 [Candidatus Micrarchaeota archaeon]